MRSLLQRQSDKNLAQDVLFQDTLKVGDDEPDEGLEESTMQAKVVD